MRNVHSSLLIVIATSLGCQAGPSPMLSLTSMLPNNGPTTSALQVRIFGTGFRQGTTLLVDNVAVDIAIVNDRVITATMPIHAAGAVEVVVTDPAGRSASMPGGFTFADFSLVSSAETVTTGSSLSVSWVAPGRPSAFDWVGFFKVGAPSSSYELGWWAYTNGQTAGTLALTAPVEPGQYEFRYLLDDGFVEAGRSRPVTVTPGASNSLSRLIPGARAGGT
jgi:IPT/TIG domain